MIRIFRKREQLPAVIEEVTETYADPDLCLHHLEETPLPSEDVIVSILGKFRTILYPGYFGREYVSRTGVNFYVGELLYDCLLYTSDAADE